MIRHLCLITNNYPTSRFIERGAFVESLVREWELLGLEVSVIAPESIPSILRSIKSKKHNIKISGKSVERPIYPSFSNKKFGPINLKMITRKCFNNAVRRKVNKIVIPDCYYGKFLMSGGSSALQIGIKNKRPAYVDLGESSLLNRLDPQDLKWAKQYINLFAGIICVSERLVEEVIRIGAQPKNILFAPNSADQTRFRPKEKILCRAKLRLPIDEFIVAFVGHFIERKGPLRVQKAIDSLDIPVKGIFLGRGPQKPSGKNVLHVGPVPNKELPDWLNAADIFVLPTLAEGYCNAINEAMACGLPIVTSDIPDVRVQVPDSTGVFINPLEIGEIASAIRLLVTDVDLRQSIRHNLLQLNEEKGDSRGYKILNWIREKNEHFSFV